MLQQGVPSSSPQPPAAQAQRRAAALLTTHKAELEAFEADGSKLFAWVEQNAPAAAKKWADGGYSNERKWLLKAEWTRRLRWVGLNDDPGEHKAANPDMLPDYPPVEPVQRPR